MERVLMKIVVRAEDDRVVGVHIVSPARPRNHPRPSPSPLNGRDQEDFDRTCALHPSIAEEL